MPSNLREVELKEVDEVLVSDSKLVLDSTRIKNGEELDFKITLPKEKAMKLARNILAAIDVEGEDGGCHCSDDEDE